MDPHDDLHEYLRGGSALSRHYRKESAPAPPHALDRRVLKLSREALGKSPCLAPLAFAASVLLSVAVVLAILFGPQTAERRDDAPRLVRVAARVDAATIAPLNRKPQLYSSDPKLLRPPSAWLAHIAALRRAGRGSEADAELRRFRAAYPDYSGSEPAMRP
jgi:hypothetical protein